MALLAFFSSLQLHALLRLLVVLTSVAERPESRRACSWQWYFFFSFLAFLLKVLLAGKKFSSFGAKDNRSFLIKLL